MNDDFWKDVINGLQIPAPDMSTLENPSETIEAVDEESKETAKYDLKSVGQFSRVSMDVYFFTDNETKKFFMMQHQSMEDMGEMTLKKATEIVKRRNKRKN